MFVVVFSVDHKMLLPQNIICVTAKAFHYDCTVDKTTSFIISLCIRSEKILVGSSFCLSTQ